ncbi:hypothetical protein BABINDRAFT_161174 [Babjeviella inositovora NRRL Y-12698]|uniref:Metal resistance protein YCF1 n=1 Tax=Babjeviella inositovora NRRL Y-12698 TaxID=984486 RepID=A0A1E3QR80_9ASCO|nr:uncharacterized protein BABINDRAFT_161174 [Babjeviella inositovora NRRL Y-12698]ODQ80199.1 hypothetical protein BABINDRAFT_161174 [Babjeviella inositovora NRRL Y-12698]
MAANSTLPVPLALFALCSSAEGWGPVSQYHDFTPCFVDGLVNAASGFLLLLGATQVARMRVAKPWYPFVKDFYFYLKLSLVAFQAALYGGLAVLAAPGSIVTPVLAIISLVVAFAAHYLQHNKRVVSSSVLLTYWFLSIVFGAFKLVNFWMRSDLNDAFVAQALLTANALVILIVEHTSTKKAAPRDVVFQKLLARLSPYEKADLFSKITFTWMTPLMRKGHEQFLTEKHLPTLPKELQSSTSSTLFTLNYYNDAHKPKISLTRALLKSFAQSFLLGGVFKAIQDCLAFVQPQLLRLLIKFVTTYTDDKTPQEPLIKGLAIAGAMFVVGVCQTAALHQYFQRAFDTGMKLKSSLISTIYQKSLKLSNESKGSKNTGDIVNLMSVDTQRLQDLTQNLTIMWSGPFQIILCLASLHSLLGNAMWAGVLIMVIMIPFNGFLARIQKTLQKQQMKNKDERTRLISEILNNIKSLKLYGWEEPYKSKLNYVRNEKELKNLKVMGIFQAISNLTWSVAPFLVSCFTFALFVTINKDTPLSTDIVFPALALFNLLSFPLAVIPNVITSVVEASVAISRLSSFFEMEELQIDAVQRIPTKAANVGDISVEVSGGTFLWSRVPTYKVALSDINFIARKGQLTCVVGKVGSGKSSLVQAILGDLYKSQGTVVTHGKIAYTSQVAWIMNGTVKENILFGHKYDPAFYQQVLKACALTVDLQILPEGDATEVGEKGISLSGGQKARLSLARAVYSRADIYLLDDPLSAVDEHVGRHLIDHVLGPNGLLSHKCKILATNSISVLEIANHISMVSGGEIVESGTYMDVLAKPESHLAQLINEFGKKKRTGAAESVITTRAGTPDNVNLDNLESDVASLVDGVSLRRASLASLRYHDDEEEDVEQQNGASTNKYEFREQGKVKWDVYFAYAKACNPQWVILLLSFMVLSMGASVSGNLWLKHWSEVNTEKGYNPHVGMYLGVYFGLGFLASSLTLSQTVILWIFCSIQGSKYLHNGMVDSVLRAPMSFFETTPIGRILNRFSNDIYKVDEILARVFSMFFANSVKVLFTIIVICFTTWEFLFMVLPLGVLYIYYQQYYLKTSRELRRLDSVSRSPVFAHFQETLNGVSLLRAYGQEERFNFLNESKVDRNMQAYNPSINANRWLAVRLEFLGSLVILGAAGLSIIALPSGKITAGMVGLSVSYALQITQSLNWIVRMTVEVESNIVSVERIMEYSELVPEAPEIIEYNRPPANWPRQGAIKFNEYSTKYRPELDLVLRKISLEINPREKVGIVGRTGAGKSSLTMALFRIIESTHGNIEIDGIRTSSIGLSDLRHKLSIIPQDSQVFEGTIRDNLDPTEVFSDEQIWKALELSHLKHHVLTMEQDGEGSGLHVKLSEGGSNLSVGQRQLMCLARALLIPSAILVLDEATAAVDVETDRLIQETIRDAFKDRTILTIAHRLNTILDSDRIIVLEKGEVAEFDTPANLLKKKESLFYALCKEGGFVNEE